MKKMFVGLFVIGFAITMLFNYSAKASTEKQVESNLAKINANLQKEIENRTPLSFSSNPYDYIKDSVEFQNIVNLGEDALPILEQKIDETPNSGLNDYILAIAAEKISKVDLKKKEESAWATGDEFSAKWKKHLKNIPAKVEQVVKSEKSSEEKIKELQDLGTPALPFIVEQIASGNENIAPAVNDLIKGNNSIKVGPSEKIDKKWAEENKSKFDDLKNYVKSKSSS